MQYRVGLEKQLFEKVIHVENNNIQLTNYMTGDNGVYRWEYKSLGKNKGYEGYQLTDSFGRGWWSFLPGKRIKDLYYQYSLQLGGKDKVAQCTTKLKSFTQKKYGKETVDCVYILNSIMASRLQPK